MANNKQEIDEMNGDGKIAGYDKNDFPFLGVKISMVGGINREYLRMSINDHSELLSNLKDSSFITIGKEHINVSNIILVTLIDPRDEGKSFSDIVVDVVGDGSIK